MNHLRFDDFARQLGEITHSRTDRRTFLSALGLGGAALITGGAITVAQDATPSPEVPAAPSIRVPGGKNAEDTAFDLALDVETIFRFVSDEVRYEPYTGALRGAKGTLWGLAGNSVDKAQLLAELLKSALFEVRFAVGALDDAAATRVLETAAIDAATAKAHAEKVMNANLVENEQPDLSNLTLEQQEALAKLPQTKEALLALVKERLVDEVGTLEVALADAGVAVTSAAETLPDLERTQHIWVQYAAGTEWVDLDPTLPNAQEGETLATASQTLDELPLELFHTIDIRVIAEANTGGVPTRRDLLFHSANAQDLVGMPLTVMHVKPDSLKGLGVTIAAAFGGALQWSPHLIYGENILAGEAMTFKSPEGDIFGSESTPTDDLSGALGGAASGEGDTLAAWLAVDLHTPDGQTRSAERVIFDRVDPADRLAGTFDASAIPPITLTPSGNELGDLYLPLAASTTLAVAGHRVPGDFFTQDYSISDQRADLANVAFAHHFVRSGLDAEAAAETGYYLFPNEPNVTGLTLTPLAIEASADGRLAVSLDMFHQSFGATALDGATAIVNPAIVSGILGHLAERAVFGELATFVPTPEGKAYRSAGRVFEEAKKNNIPLTVLQPGGSPSGLDISPSAQALITEALNAGKVVVVPEREVSLDGTTFTAWWQIDPLTGETIDRTEFGGSQDMAEYNILLGELLEAIHKLATLAMCVTGVAFGAAAIVGAFGAGGVGAGWGGVIFGGAMCLAAGFS